MDVKNQREALQYLYNKFGEFKVAEEYKPNKYSKRYLVSEYLKNNKEPECIHRQILPNGLVIESDAVSYTHLTLPTKRIV